MAEKVTAPLLVLLSTTVKLPTPLIVAIPA